MPGSKAIYKIPARPAPQLAHQSYWSSNFHDMLKLALLKDYAQRPSANKLLKHPFFKGVNDGSARQAIRTSIHFLPNHVPGEFDNLDDSEPPPEDAKSPEPPVASPSPPPAPKVEAPPEVSLLRRGGGGRWEMWKRE